MPLVTAGYYPLTEGALLIIFGGQVWKIVGKPGYCSDNLSTQSGVYDVSAIVAPLPHLIKSNILREINNFSSCFKNFTLYTQVFAATLMQKGYMMIYFQITTNLFDQVNFKFFTF